MGFAGKHDEVADAKPFCGVVPVNAARRLVDEERERVGIVEPHLPGAHGEAPGQALKGLVRPKAPVELEADRPFGEQRRRFLVERFEVGEAHVVRLEREGCRVADARAGLHRPRP